MRDAEGRSRAGLLSVIVVLVLAIVVLFVLWQRDQESKDLEVQVGVHDGRTLVEPARPDAHRASGPLSTLRRG